MKLSLGPVLYYWPHEQLQAFYQAAADWPVDIVYLGETVCSRRHAFRLEDWLTTAGRLADAGKEVVLSTQALIESESDLKALRRLVDQGRFRIEANDMGAVQLASGQPFVAGPHINTYNPHTLEILAEAGATRWVMPVEMSREMLQALRAEERHGLECEVFAYGRLPLAFSARCFTARRYNLPKDNCQFRCMDAPYGLTLHTREGQPFLALNGTQTQSASVYNLLPAIAELRGLADIVRISPQPQGTENVVRLFREALEQTADPAALDFALFPHLPTAACNGYWHGKPGIEECPTARSAT